MQAQPSFAGVWAELGKYSKSHCTRELYKYLVLIRTDKSIFVAGLYNCTQLSREGSSNCRLCTLPSCYSVYKIQLYSVQLYLVHYTMDTVHSTQ